jgi:hypothetical protein
MEDGIKLGPRLKRQSMAASGWKLDPKQRGALLERFPPHWPNVVADHITLNSHDQTGCTPAPATCSIVGAVDDGQGLQALVVAIDGTTARPDGSVFHITWSLDEARGRKPIESNAVLLRLGWTPIDPEQPISIIPALW